VPEVSLTFFMAGFELSMTGLESFEQAEPVGSWKTLREYDYMVASQYNRDVVATLHYAAAPSREDLPEGKAIEIECHVKPVDRNVGLIIRSYTKKYSLERCLVKCTQATDITSMATIKSFAWDRMRAKQGRVGRIEMLPSKLSDEDTYRLRQIFSE